MIKFLEATSRFCDGITTRGHGDPSSDLTKLLPDSFTRIRSAVLGDL